MSVLCDVMDEKGVYHPGMTIEIFLKRNYEGLNSI